MCTKVNAGAFFSQGLCMRKEVKRKDCGGLGCCGLNLIGLFVELYSIWTLLPELRSLNISGKIFRIWAIGAAAVFWH